MEKIFRLYRYLAQNQDRHNDDNPYNTALRTLESVLDLLAVLEGWGQRVVDRGGFEWKDCEQIVEQIAVSHKTGLCEANGQQGAMHAIIDFADTHIPLGEYDGLIAMLMAQKEAEQQRYKESEEALGDLDDHPF